MKPNCTKKGKEYYRFTATIGGKRREFYGKTQRIALDKRDRAIAEYEAGLCYDLSEQSLGKAMHEWLYRVKKVDQRVSDSSFCRYEGTFRLLIAASELARMKVSAVRVLHVQEYINDIADVHGSSQAASALKIIRMFYRYAAQEGYTLRNPCTNVVTPGHRQQETPIVVFEDDEIDRIKETLIGHPLELFILMALGTGLRKGELLALTYDDIKDGCVYVTKSLTAPTAVSKDGTRERRIVIGPTKTKSSNRIIPLPDNLNAIIEATRKEGAFLFTDKKGELYDPAKIDRMYTTLLRKAGVCHQKFHTLRHTFATRLILAGVVPAVVQDLMGHSDINMTMRYTHTGIEDKTRAVNILNGLVSTAVSAPAPQ